jgi:hypothetical protein
MILNGNNIISLNCKIIELQKNIFIDIKKYLCYRLNVQHPNAVYTSRLLNESILTVNSSRKRKLAFGPQNNGK